MPSFVKSTNADSTAGDVVTLLLVLVNFAAILWFAIIYIRNVRQRDGDLGHESSSVHPVSVLVCNGTEAGVSGEAHQLDGAVQSAAAQQAAAPSNL